MTTHIYPQTHNAYNHISAVLNGMNKEVIKYDTDMVITIVNCDATQAWEYLVINGVNPASFKFDCYE